MGAGQRTLTRWDDPAYRHMASVEGRPDGHIDIAFADGTTVQLDGHRLVRPDAAAAYWEKAYLGERGLEIVVPSERGEELAIPWDVIRSLTDPGFAAHMAQAAEEQNRVIGTKLRALRKGRHLTAEELAARAGITPQALSHIEQGKPGVAMTTLGKILAAMGYGYRALVVEDEDENDEAPPAMGEPNR